MVLVEVWAAHLHSEDIGHAVNFLVVMARFWSVREIMVKIMAIFEIFPFEKSNRADKW
jgi:hypothetical protein